eukprot:2789396-Amphidinium_carterae.1
MATMTKKAPSRYAEHTRTHISAGFAPNSSRTGNCSMVCILWKAFDPTTTQATHKGLSGVARFVHLREKAPSG